MGRSRESPSTSAHALAAEAEGGEVLVSQTVRDLVAGSGIDFDERGDHELKGIPGTWRLIAFEPREVRVALERRGRPAEDG